MKAMVLCAGMGTRLGDLTEDIPKPLLEVAGQPILGYILDNLYRHGFRDVVINLHHHPKAIPDRFGDGSRMGLRITYLYEPELLGTAGGVRNAARLLQGSTHFLVHYGDVLTDEDLSAMVVFHRERRAEATLLVHERNQSNSIICLDSGQRVVRILERPSEEERKTASSPWVNSGVYLLDTPILDRIARDVPSDFPKQVFPDLIQRGAVYGFPLKGHRFAIDSPERLAQAREQVPEWAPRK